jgi:GTP-binding protein
VKPHIQFLTSAASEEQFPSGGAPEIAFLGRSNVGKSSLLNSLTDAKVARVSSTPGRTRTINFFAVRWKAKQVNPDLLLADLPGYGYARVSHEVSAGWAKFVDPYLETRKTLALCVVLLDVNVPPQENDRQLLQFLRHVKRDFIVVATKSDKLSGNKRRSALNALIKAHDLQEIIAYSAKTGAGRAELWRKIQLITGA